MFEGHEVEVFELNGRVLFNSKHVGKCLDLSESAVRNYLAQMNQKQAIIVKNSDVRDKDIRKLNNAGEKFLTESGVYKLVFKSRNQRYIDSGYFQVKESTFKTPYGEKTAQTTYVTGKGQIYITEKLRKCYS